MSKSCGIQHFKASYCVYCDVLGSEIIRSQLTHWGRVTHTCVRKLTTIVSDNGLSPGRRQAIIWTSAVKLLIKPLGTNFSENLIEIQTYSLNKIRLKTSSSECCSSRPHCVKSSLLKMATRVSTNNPGRELMSLGICPACGNHSYRHDHDVGQRFWLSPCGNGLGWRSRYVSSKFYWLIFMNG